jgi:hypothetical protein
MQIDPYAVAVPIGLRLNDIFLTSGPGLLGPSSVVVVLLRDTAVAELFVEEARQTR